MSPFSQIQAYEIQLSSLFAKKMSTNIYHLATHLTTKRRNKLLEVILKEITQLYWTILLAHLYVLIHHVSSSWSWFWSITEHITEFWLEAFMSFQTIKKKQRCIYQKGDWIFFSPWTMFSPWTHCWRCQGCSRRWTSPLSASSSWTSWSLGSSAGKAPPAWLLWESRSLFPGQTRIPLALTRTLGKGHLNKWALHFKSSKINSNQSCLKMSRNTYMIRTIIFWAVDV